MAATDFFYLSLGGGFLVLVGCFVFITIQIWRILGDVRTVSEDVSGVVEDLMSLKDGLKTAGITFVQNMLERAKKGGKEKDGK